MFILRILLKTALLPVVLILLFVKVIVKVGMQLSSIILGGLILFVAGCLIYTITKQAWSQTFLLALIEAGIMGITIGTAVIESLIDAALMGIAGI
ncbi:MAG: hypothetical protein SPL54_03295 [Lachnospiraceae bacterium]|jgi:NADH-quinone oxidoreductase subunit A|uniref:hypothetical protein n=1 Tax=Chordicoccus furentiruminis TaxID=2709410 RepID=UPI0023A7EFEB|nr:hypothetical protein [Chordicoccus furentiruminis]MDY6305807.1 hypothetical protein [Oribacterium sp.]MDY6341275.1 hypothetical protein [Lachnospiraceae bacterium]MEE0955698.1 hypothetical protein [Eubacterium sp.]